MSLKQESEHQTRKLRIDKALEAAGWKVVPFDARKPPSVPCAIEEYPTANGPADYALVVAGRILGILEAKKLAVDPMNVLSQADRYAKGVEGPPVPFLYSSNGEAVWFRDVRDPRNLSRQIAGFHTPDALSEFIDRDSQDSLLALPNNHPRLRPYQIDANAAVEEAIRGRRRAMLVAMATGTGKTFTMVNQAYRLMKSGVARRILFLVDRRALAAQAVRAFTAFEPEPGLKFRSIYEVFHQRFHRDDLEDDGKFDPKVLPAEYLTRPRAKHAFVYVCTIQRMAINLFGRGATFHQGDEGADDDADKVPIPIHAFDVVIADECHRGYTTAEQAVWRDVLEHFDAIKIGLTATPAAHTKAYFKDVVYRYDYERAVREGHLVDYDAVTIRSDVRMNGVFLKEGDQVRLIDPETGAGELDVLEDDRAFDASEIERRVTAPESNRKIVQEVARYSAEHEKRHGRFPKTLIFAVNDLPFVSHADQLVTICREVFGRGEELVCKITGSPNVDRPLQRIREFRNRPKPGVVVTVDMLSTGVDIPDLEFIVFLRPVKSRILWEQMLGRGTRKGEHYPDKSHFTVFDCFDGTLLAYFKKASAFTVDPPDQPSTTVREVIEAVWDNRDRDYNIRRLIKRLQRIDKQMSGEARALFAAHIPEGDVARWARELPKALGRDYAGTMKLLRSEPFQDLLENYPRSRTPFVITEESDDKVSSEWLIRDGAGREHKPDDYLKIFEEFVARNRTGIDAIEVLLKRPADWNPKVLDDLNRRLSQAPERFTVDLLQRVHKRRYNKDLVDIISMVKLAVREGREALTKAERTMRAFERLAAGRTFTSEQQTWLDQIQAVVAENLAVEPEDFDKQPALSHHGGWKAADRVFQGRLSPLLREINQEVAA